MNKKIAFITFSVLAVFTFTVWAVTTNGPQSEHHTNDAIQVEQVSTDATGALCNPSTCKPGDASCPHPASGEATATTTSENNAQCPGTNECPPSKCQNENKAEETKATL